MQNKKYLFLIFSLIFFWGFSIKSQASMLPVLNFSDLTSGPKTGNTDGAGGLTSNQHGAIVTVWGNYLGSTQGTSKVYFTDSQAVKTEVANYYYWKNADGQLPGGPADLYTYHKMQEIAFSIPSAVADGDGTISVVVNGVESTTLPFTVRSGNIYFIKSTGNDNTGNGSWSSPWATMPNVLSGNGKISAGDIVYTVGVGNTGTIQIGQAADLFGSALSPFSIVVYPNTTSYVTTTSGNTAFHNYSHGTTVQSSAYWIFSKFTINTGYEAFSIFGYSRYVGNNVTGVMPTVSYSGFIGGSCPVTNTPTTINCSGHKVFGNEVHDYGDPTGSNNFHHLIYISNRSDKTAEAYEIGWNYFHDNPTYQGIHIYDTSSTSPWTGTLKVHDNVVKNQAGNAINIDEPSLADYQIYNNIIILDANFNPSIGTYGLPYKALRINPSSSSNLKLYNNTIYGYATTNSIDNGNVEYRNNIMVDNRNLSFAGSVNGTFAQSNNLFYSTANSSLALPSWAAGALNADPLFANAGSYDFSLQNSSPAINAGSNVVLSVAPRDFWGQPRQTGSVSVGAIEFNQALPASFSINDFVAIVQNWLKSGAIASDLNSDSIVNTKDLGIMMSKWQ